MDALDSTPFVIDFQDQSTCLGIQGAKRGQDIRVLVRPVYDVETPSIVAMGTRSRDGKSFTVVVTTANGRQRTYNFDYQHLLQTSSVLWPPVVR